MDRSRFSPTRACSFTRVAAGVICQICLNGIVPTRHAKAFIEFVGVTLLTASLILLLAMLLLVLSQCIIAGIYIRLIGRPKPYESASWTGPVGVILAVRGPDPKLSLTLEALLAQQYDDYVVHIVVDHPRDPVLEMIQQAQAETLYKTVKKNNLFLISKR